MSLPWLPQTPGIIINNFTDAEELFLQNLASLPYQDGDMLYYDNGEFQRLPIGSSNEVLTVIGGLPNWEPSGAGVTDFIDLGDVPNSYTGSGSRFVKVKATEDGLEFVAGAGVSTEWGDITGTLSNQTDLYSTLFAVAIALG